MGKKNKSILVFVKEAGEAIFFEGIQSQGGMGGHGTDTDGRTHTEGEK